MAKTAHIQVRIDEATKSKVQKILSAWDIPMSTAITMYLREIILRGGIPFDLKIPNKTTAETLEKAEAREDVFEFDTVEEALKELKS